MADMIFRFKYFTKNIPLSIYFRGYIFSRPENNSEFDSVS